MSQANRRAAWASAWLESAQQRGPLACALWPVSLVYRSLIALRRWPYALGLRASRKPEVPVIVVGNVVVGGAGKTPTTLSLVTHLQARGWRPGVISRGHGRRGDGVVHVEPDTPAHQAGDEPLLIRRRSGAPVCVARHRVEAAQALLNAHPEVNLLICDDGMQHLALGRDLTVAVFDERGLGNGWLLPAGMLREPWPLAPGSPGRPDLVLQQGRAGSATRSVSPHDGMPVFHAVRRLAAYAVAPDGQHKPLEDLHGQPLVAIAGIARPEVFFEMLRERGLKLAGCVSLPDHAVATDYEGAIHSARHPLICTEKDAVKLFPILPADGSLQAWAVPLELAPERAFLDQVDAHLARLSSRHGHQTA